MSTNLRLALEVACGVIAIASTSLVLYNVLSASSRNAPERTSGTNRSQRDDTNDQNPAAPLGQMPLMPPPYMPPPPPPIPPVYIVAPQMPMPQYPMPFMGP